MTKFNKIFEKVLKKLKPLIEDDDFYHKLSHNLKILKYEDGTIYFETDDKDIFNYVKKKTNNDFAKIVRDVFDSNDLVIEIEKSENFDDSSTKNTNSKNSQPDKKTTGLINVTGTLSFDNYILTKETKKIKDSIIKLLDKKYKFSRFPIFIYGNSGTGKTHLVNAFANYAYQQNPNFNVYYVGAIEFEQMLSDAIRSPNTSKEINQLKLNILSNDIMIIDDFQMFAEKQNSLKIFFDIFNEMKNRNTILLITSDRAIESINGLTDRCMSRLCGGVKIQMPEMDIDSRKELVLKLIENYQFDLKFSDDALELFCTVYSRDIRSLIGALSSLDLHLSLTNINGLPNVVYPDEMVSILDLKNVLLPKKKDKIETNITPDLIVNAISMSFGIKSDDIKSRNRGHDVVKARNLIIYVLHKKLDLNHSQISELLKKNRTTVTVSLKKNTRLFDTDKKIQDLIDSIFKELHS